MVRFPHSILLHLFSCLAQAWHRIALIPLGSDESYP